MRLLMTMVFLLFISLHLSAGTFPPKGNPLNEKPAGKSPKLRKNKKDSRSFQKDPVNKTIMREIPSEFFESETKETADTTPFKPSINLGSIVHMGATYAQGGFGPGGNFSEGWNKAANVYRARILVGGQLSRKGAFFMETEIPRPLGTFSNSPLVAPFILDCQYEHTFSNAFMLIAGQQLVSNNRNGLQGAASLMANDFSWFQYPFNIPGPANFLSNAFGRDIGLNARGFFLNDKLEYRLGLFSGRRFSPDAPFRTVARLVYNFLEPDKNFYYAGTQLGKGKTISLGAGLDAQATYKNFGVDLFIDVPLGPGSLTLNGAFQAITGGTDTSTVYTFVNEIPKQSIQFLELGYYFPSLKIQPWVKFENVSTSSEELQRGGASETIFNDLNSFTVFGAGVNYFFNGYGANLRLSYNSFSKGNFDFVSGTVDKKSSGQIMLQLQFFIF